VKTLHKAIVILVIAIVAVGLGLVCYLMTQGPETYELSYNFQPGESYVYDMAWKTEILGISAELSSSETLNVLQVVGNEFNFRDSATVQMTVPGQEARTVTVVVTFKMTNKGVRSGLEIENVEPPELRPLGEQTRGQLESFLAAIYHYPTGRIPIGSKWIVPADFQLQQEGTSISLTGECTSSLASRERLTVKAGTFDCWRLTHNISASGEMEAMGQKVTMTMSGQATSWIDIRSCVQTKVDLPLSVKMQAAGQEVAFPMNVTIELTKYQTP